MEERLQKILSKCGIVSRRKAEELILEGHVRVNGAVAALGMKADLAKDHIKVRGKLIRDSGPRVYLMINKPGKCVTTMHDPEGRRTVKDFLKGVKANVFPVGRLDYNSEGLIVMTNDGELSNAILHPKNKIPKTYLVKIKGVIEDKNVLKLRDGVRLKDGLTAPAKVKKIRKTGTNSWVEITIHEGKNRQVRRMLERVGHQIIKLRRTRINGLELGKLLPGAFRYLSPVEVNRIKKEVL